MWAETVPTGSSVPRCRARDCFARSSIDGRTRVRKTLLACPFDEEPRAAAVSRVLEVSLVHPQPLLLELAHRVVRPRHVEPANDRQVVRPAHQVGEGGRRRAQVDLVEDRGRERVGVAEEHPACLGREEVLVPAGDPRDVRELGSSSTAPPDRDRSPCRGVRTPGSTACRRPPRGRTRASSYRSTPRPACAPA